MKVLLKDGADKATAATVLIIPQRINDALETLSGEAAPHGIVAEADEAVVIDALNAAAKTKKRADQYLTAKDLRKETQWMAKALAEFEVGSKIGLILKGGGSFRLDTSRAKKINRAEGLTKGDLVAIGPWISPKALMNARGRVLSIDGDSAQIELDAGDRDRFQRATGKQLARQTTFHLTTLEKVPEEGQ
jgi:hypothetical protein